MRQIWLLAVLCSPILGQTTQGIILGRITDLGHGTLDFLRVGELH